MFTPILYLYQAILAPLNPQLLGASGVELASHSISLEKRYGNEFVNNVMRDNILLTVHYMAGEVGGKNDVVWEEIAKPYKYKFELNPGETFAFHDTVLPEYESRVVKTTNAHFNFDDGFKSDGWLFGDGVCHLASLIHWTALDAGLTSVSLASHDFAAIPEIPKEFGVSIKYMPGQPSNSARQNLYITNNQGEPVRFVFEYNGKDLEVSVLKEANY